MFSVEEPFLVTTADVSRAHFYADAVRDVHVRLPDEDPKAKQPGVRGKLRKDDVGSRSSQSWTVSFMGSTLTLRQWRIEYEPDQQHVSRALIEGSGTDRRPMRATLTVIEALPLADGRSQVERCVRSEMHVDAWSGSARQAAVAETCASASAGSLSSYSTIAVARRVKCPKWSQVDRVMGNTGRLVLMMADSTVALCRGRW